MIGVIKSRQMGLTGHVALVRERRGAYRVLVGNPMGGDRLEDVGMCGRIILK
jgi:hypothetical protein